MQLPEIVVTTIFRALTANIRDFKIYDAVVDENATKQHYHWLKEEK